MNDVQRKLARAERVLYTAVVLLALRIMWLAFLVEASLLGIATVAFAALCVLGALGLVSKARFEFVRRGGDCPPPRERRMA